VLAGSVWFEQQDMEDLVDLPFLRKRKGDRECGDDSFDLEWTVIFVIQLP